MRPALLLLATMLAGLALTGAARLRAQAVERSDIAARGVLRLTFEPRVMTWNSDFTDAGRLGLGRGLTGDRVGGRYIPTVAQLQRDIRLASGVGSFVASLGQGLLSVYQERRTYPVTAELGLSDRLSVSLMVPIVRVATRTALQLSPQNSTLGLNPRLTDVTARARDSTFFAHFNAALAQLNQYIGSQCPASPQCAQARADSASWTAVRDALNRSVNGVGQTGQSFLPRDSSDGGKGIFSTVQKIQQDMGTFGVGGAFRDTLLLPSVAVNPDLMQTAMLDSATGFGYRGLPFRNGWRINLGDVELAAKYRLVAGARYAAAAALVLRLPTGARDSADDWLRQSIGDHHLNVEGRLLQELTVGPLWLNLAVRAGTQRPGTRIRRVAPWDALLVPATATTTLRWAAGDYVGLDVAPLVRLAPQFAAGFTAGYWTKRRDQYAFRSPADSVALATGLGVPTAASVLNQGTSERRVRLGFALTYAGPTVEGGLSIEQTVMGAGVVPAATVYRIVFRTARKLF